jgi:hypothetical protein
MTSQVRIAFNMDKIGLNSKSKLSLKLLLTQILNMSVVVLEMVTADIVKESPLHLRDKEPIQ